MKKKILAKAGIKSDGTKRLTLSSGLIKEKNQDFLGSKTYHTDTTIEGVLRHEFGHIKIYQLVDKLKWATKDRKYSASEIEYAIAMKSSKIENILDFPKISNKDMSEYGITSAAEFCAESFSNKEYSQMTKDAYKIMTNPDKVAEVLKEFSSTAQKEGVKIINSKNNYKDICVGYFVSKKDYDNYMKSRIERLNFLQKTFNGGKGSGNFNPGQGRGVGKPGNGASTKSDKALFESVKQMADIFSSMNKREGYKYSSSEDLVLKQGKFFTPEKRPEDVKLGSKKECFANASKLALERSNLTYVEGYAMVNDRLPLPIAHAWCVDKKGRVIDNTWENPGVSYFGVPFKTSYLAKKLSETGVYGILSGSVGSSDFLKDGVPSDWVADIKKQKNSYEPSIKDKLNNLIYKMNEVTGKRGNPYHDEKGRFTSGPSSSSKGGSKSSILEKGGIEGGYLTHKLDELNDEQLSKLAKNPIANLSDKRLKEVASMREKMYGTRDEFDLANQWLMSIVGNSADIMDKARYLNFDPSKEIELSRKIIGDKEVTLFRNQEGEFDKKNYKESRWGDIPHSHSSSGNDYTIKGNKDNILIHPEVLYSADINDPYYRQEREYVVDNSKIKDIWRGVKL